MRPSALVPTTLLLVLCAAANSAASPSGAGREATPAVDSTTAFAFREVQLELGLARSDTPYLVIVPSRKALQVKLKGVLMWECPLDSDSGQTEEANSFYERFRGPERFACRTVVGRHVYAYSEQIPDSILATIAEATGFSPALIQRDIPARMFISWGEGLLVEIRTDIEGTRKPRFDNVLFDVRRAVSEVGQPGHPVFRTTPESAMTLARLARVGMFTLLDLSE